MPLTTAVRHYAALKRGLGYRFLDQEQMLLQYAAFADAAGDAYIMSARALEWAGKARAARRSQARLSVVRHFAIAMHAEDDRHQIPPRDAFGRGKPPRPRPHILTVAQIERILEAARAIPPIASLTPYTYRYLIGLIATTGLRVAEAVELRQTDLTRDGLVIRETKFHKTRLVPITDCTRRALEHYLVLRRRIGGSDPHLFVLSNGRSTDRSSVTRAFIELARRVGVRRVAGRGPRLHDLRHSFAVRSLEACGSGRAAIDRHVLALSTYLGHASLSDTYWYLEATPVLTRQIADAAEAFHAGGAA